MSKKNLTFAEQTRAEYVKDIFTAPMVVACLIYFFKVLLWGAEDRFFYHSSWQLLPFFLFPALAVFVPLFFYNRAVRDKNEHLLHGARAKANPAYFVLGSIAVCGISVPMWHVFSLLVEEMKAAGFVFYPRTPNLEGTAGTVIFVLLAAAVPSFFYSLSVHGYFLENTKKASDTGAVVLSALVFALPRCV